jgi:hypothetical protein
VSHEEVQIADALARCRMGMNSYARNFARGLAAMAHESPPAELTAPQRRHLLKLVVQYRRQIPAAVVELAKRKQAAEPDDLVRED